MLLLRRQRVPDTPHIVVPIQLAGLRRNGRPLRDEVLPLGGEIVERGHVGFPGLRIGRIGGLFLVAIGIFVRQPAEGVAELVDHHGDEGRMVAVHDRDGIVDAAAAVNRGVHEDDHVLERNRADGVIDLLHGGGRQIPGGVEGVEMAVQGGPEPFPGTGDADAGLLRRRKDGTHGEVVPVTGERLMAEQRLGDALRIPVELGLLGGGISFRHHDDVDGRFHGASLPDDGGGMAVPGLPADQDVRRVDPVAQARGYLPVRVHEEDLHIHRPFREGNLETVLKGLLHMQGFRGDLPLLEQGGEGIGIQALARFRIQHPDLAVPLQQGLGQIVAPAGPLGGSQGLLEIDRLVAGIPAEHIVQPECRILEIGVEVPGGEAGDHQGEGQKGQEGSSHITLHLGCHSSRGARPLPLHRSRILWRAGP